jgi:hypothetical protein
MISVVVSSARLLQNLNTTMNIKYLASCFAHNSHMIFTVINPHLCNFGRIIHKPSKTRACLLKATKPSEKFFPDLLSCHLQGFVILYSQKTTRRNDSILGSYCTSLSFFHLFNDLFFLYLRL